MREEPGVEGREAKDRLYEQFARAAKAAASPKRIELLELLAQGERAVEELARATGMGVTNTSTHLQVLRGARLVETRKVGTKVFYRLAGDEVAVFVVALRDLARSRLAEVDEVMRDYFTARDALEPLSRSELVERAGRGEVVILDVRPAAEFAAGHIRAPCRYRLTSSTPPWPACPGGPRSSPIAGARTACWPPRRSSGSGPAGSRPGAWRTGCPNGAWRASRWPSEHSDERDSADSTSGLASKSCQHTKASRSSAARCRVTSSMAVERSSPVAAPVTARRPASAGGGAAPSAHVERRVGPGGPPPRSPSA